jgi:PAS domain S-box-containing protein
MKDAADLRFVRFNKAAEELFGYPRAIMLGKNDFDFFPYEMAAAFTGKDREVLNSGLVVNISEEKVNTAFGQERLLHTRKVPIYGADGKPRFLLGVAEDITERKRADEQLRTSEERFKLVTYATNDAVWELDLSTRRRWWNAGVRSVFGYVPDQVGIDQTWWEELIHPDDRLKVLASLEKAISSDGQFWSKEYRYRKAGGDYAYVFDRGYIILDEYSHPQRIIGAMMDITERKRTETALRQSEETFSKAFHACPLAMAIVDVQSGVYMDINDGWEILMNRERAAVIGKSTRAFDLGVKPAAVRGLMTALHEKGSVRDFEITCVNETGEERVLLVSIQMADSHGKAA